MYLPQTYFIALVMLAVSMACWGSWANTFKLTRGYRFELFYWDYILGMVLAALAYGVTLGNSGGYGRSFLADLSAASAGNIASVVMSGVVFNVANLLLVAAIEIAGLAVAFPVGIGLALIIGAMGNYVVNPKGNPLLLFGGVALVAVAIVLDALAYRALTASTASQALAAASGSSASQQPAAPSGSGSIRQSGIVLSLASGVLMGSFYPLYAHATFSKANPDGLGPYAGFLLFAVGALLCTLPLNGLYFMRKPIRGVPVSFGQYFGARGGWHLLGIIGGLIWGTGAAFNFIAGAAGNYGAAAAGQAVSYALGQGATMVSAIWGVFIWREFRGAGPAATRLLAFMFVFFAAGLALVAIAPLH